MGRSTIIINGKTYDAITGLPVEIDESRSVDQVPEYAEVIKEEARIEEPAQSITKESRPVVKTMSKQERLAEAVAREFDLGEEPEQTRELALEPVPVETVESAKTAEVELRDQQDTHLPAWLSDFTETAVASTDQSPAWISNYVEGGAPIEIEPIGLEKAAKDKLAENQTSESFSTTQSQAHSIHRQPQHSTTLNRRFVKKPVERAHAGVLRAASAPVATHPSVHKFAEYEVPVKTKKVAPETAEMAKEEFRPVLSRRHEEKLVDRAKVKEHSELSLKDFLIQEQMADSEDDQNLSRKEKKAKKRQAQANAVKVKRHFRAPTLITAALSVAIIGGFITYTQMPNISVRVAANRAGIDAKNPYKPNGYSIDGPVAYQPGQVTIKYRSNGGGAGYSFTQSTSSLNSNAVRDDVSKTSGDYDTIVSGDLTIYRYGNNATWVKNGILYTLNGNDHMGSNQILEIADSI